jgi:hypothetical protein
MKYKIDKRSKGAKSFQNEGNYLPTPIMGSSKRLGKSNESFYAGRYADATKRANQRESINFDHMVQEN